jgi:hypothetical protein
MHIDNTVIVDALQGIVVAYLLALGTFVVQWINTHATAKKIDIAKTLIQTAVKATEQVSEKLNWQPETKKADAIKRAQVLLASHGINKTDEEIGTYVEDAVDNMRKWWDAAKGKDAGSTTVQATIQVPPVPSTLTTAFVPQIGNVESTSSPSSPPESDSTSEAPAETEPAPSENAPEEPTEDPAPAATQALGAFTADLVIHNPDGTQTVMPITLTALPEPVSATEDTAADVAAPVAAV